MNTFHSLTVDGQTYTIASSIQDDGVSPNTTWSSEKIAGLLGDTEQALDSILAMQEKLMGGETV